MCTMKFQFQPGTSLFHRSDPLSKLLWLLSVSAIAVAYEEALIQALLLLVLVLIGRYGAGVPYPSLWKGLRLPFWLGVPFFVLQLLFVPGSTRILSLGSLHITTEALDFAAAITCRLLTLVLTSLLYTATTDPHDLVMALTLKLRVPYRFAYAVLIALRFLPVLEAEAALIQAAQKRRGTLAESGWKQKLKRKRQFALQVFISSIRKVEHTALVMEAKGFGASRHRTYRRKLVFRPEGILLAAVSMLLTGIILWTY